MCSLKNNDWNKWELIYNGTDKGIEYLSQKQYELFVQAIKTKEPQILLKDGRILPTWGARIHRNPDCVLDDDLIPYTKKDGTVIQVTRKQLREAIDKQEKYLAEKRDRNLFDD